MNVAKRSRRHVFIMMNVATKKQETSEIFAYRDPPIP